MILNKKDDDLENVNEKFCLIALIILLSTALGSSTVKTCVIKVIAAAKTDASKGHVSATGIRGGQFKGTF